jgi:chromosomal replication initiation ATPase DnaA
MGAIIGIVSEYYQVKREDLLHSRRGYFNEARNIAMYLSRRLRGDRLKEIGEDFGLGKYSSVSSVVERVKVLIEKDKVLKERVDHLISMIIKGQEQT